MNLITPFPHYKATDFNSGINYFTPRLSGAVHIIINVCKRLSVLKGL